MTTDAVDVRNLNLGIRLRLDSIRQDGLGWSATFGGLVIDQKIIVPISAESVDALTVGRYYVFAAIREEPMSTSHETQGLTVDDLHATLNDDRHLGFGYAEVDLLVKGETRERLDATIIEVANELGMSREDLFHWSNSKYGRWMGDAVYGCNEPPNRKTVEGLLNAEAVRISQDGIIWRNETEDSCVSK